MADLRSRIVSHAEKVKRVEEMEAALAGVFSLEAQAAREKFEELVKSVIKPTFDEFKKTVREVGRDAVIVTSLTHTPVQSISVTLVDKYLSFGAGKTLKLVNPKEDITKRSNTKFYEVYRADDSVYVRQRADPQMQPISTMVTPEMLVPEFFENELASFFERAYPTTSP
jgi:hypothetical protein